MDIKLKYGMQAGLLKIVIKKKERKKSDFSGF